MSLSQSCCSIPPVQSTYKPVGTLEKVNGELPVYVVGPNVSFRVYVTHHTKKKYCRNLIACVQDAKKAVLVFYDIFGFQ